MTDLSHHGDRELGPGLVDLAVNVRQPPPDWLRRELAGCLEKLAAYPDPTAATEAVAARHGVDPARVLLTAGAAEAFTLLARAVPAECPVLVHPQFTEPESALRAAGRDVRRVLLSEEDGFPLDPARVPERADLVVVGNPTNPTSVLHPADTLRSLVRPGRLLVVDEAFADAIPGESESLASAGLPGVLVIRSLTKTWGLAGLRVGYLIGEPAIVDRLRAVQPPWSVSTLAATAAIACSTPTALAEAHRLAVTAETERAELVAGLANLGVTVLGEPRAPFVLIRVHDGAGLRERLRAKGFAVRRGDTFPGLTTDHLRITARDSVTTTAFLPVLGQALRPTPATPPR